MIEKGARSQEPRVRSWIPFSSSDPWLLTPGSLLLSYPIVRKLLFPVKAVTFVWRFVVLLLWTAHFEANREREG
jgi:hypothetical protein